MSRKESRIAPRILIALLASMVTMSISAVEPTKRPTLVVGIMVDGLREDYLELLKGYFGNDGFNRLMTQGVMLENVDYGPGSDYASATAMIYTGTSASVNGIASATAYDAEKKMRPIRLQHCWFRHYQMKFALMPVAPDMFIVLHPMQPSRF